MMASLPGSVLWLILFVYLVHGQLSDNLNSDKSKLEIGDAEKTVNGTRQNEEEKANENAELEKEKEEKEGKNKQPSSLINKTTATKPRAVIGKPQDSNGIHLSESFNGRNKRRRLVYKSENVSEATDFPSMSVERRNSYKSIADRRRYYNRTRIQSRRPADNIVDKDLLELQETTNRPYLPQDKVASINEIRDNKQSALIKDSNRIVTDKKNETDNQRIILGVLNNKTTLPKTDNVKQTVIHPRLEFGQKITLRKSNLRNSELRSEKPRRRKDKTKDDLIIENSTNKFNKNFQTQSTKLLRVDKNHWSTTRIPKAEIDIDNLVMPLLKNHSNLEKLSKYTNVNATNEETSVYSNVVTSISIKNGGVTQIANQTEIPILENKTVAALPLSFELGRSNKTENSSEVTDLNVVTSNASSTTVKTFTSAEKREETTLSYEEELIRSHVYAQEIYKLNTGRKRLTWNQTMPLTTTQKSDNLTDAPNVTAVSIAATATTPEPPITTNRPKINAENVTRKSERNPATSYQDSTPSFKNVLVNESTTEKSTASSSPSSKSTNQNPTRIYSSKISNPRNLNASESFLPTSSSSTSTSTSATPSATTTTTTTSTTTTEKAQTATEMISTTEEYPVTIEINENNKRVLSEMFQTTTMTESTKLLLSSTTSRSSSTTPTPETTPSETSSGNSLDDHKSLGSSYNTKFYLVPNVTRTEVIKIIEDEDAEEEEEEVLVTAQTVGIAVYVLAAFGLVPLLLALVFAAKFLVQRHRRKDDSDSDIRSYISANETRARHGKLKGSTDLKKSPSNVTTTTLVATTRLPRVQHWENCEKHINKNWEFPRTKLKLQTILGQGNFGQVWKAEAEDVSGHEGTTRLVAVKTVKEGATEKEHSELIKELEIMQQIGSHPNIVTLLGCCTDQEPYYLIMEYVMYGKLLTFLRDHRTNENYYNFSNDTEALTSRDLTVFGYCVARGMEYLASKGIIHRDLAARNVLVDHNKLCKIADFGMSRSVRDTEDGQVYEERQHKGALPIRWMAPESLVYSLFTHKSDVWSFGIVMWEIVTLGSTPYPNMGAREVMRKVRDGYRLERPDHCKPELYRLISHCWAHDPNKRPDFTELRHELSNLLDDPTKDGSYVDLDRFAIDNRFHLSNKTNEVRLSERNEFKSLKRLGDWEAQDWPEEPKRSRSKKNKNNGKGTVTLTGQGSFTVNSRILEKEFKMV